MRVVYLVIILISCKVSSLNCLKIKEQTRNIISIKEGKSSVRSAYLIDHLTKIIEATCKKGRDFDRIIIVEKSKASSSSKDGLIYLPAKRKYYEYTFRGDKKPRLKDYKSNNVQLELLIEQLEQKSSTIIDSFLLHRSNQIIMDASYLDILVVDLIDPQKDGFYSIENF